MRKKLLFYGIFFAVLVTGFYFAMTSLLPGFGTVKLPVLNYVQPFSFVNQDSSRISQQSLEGKVYVAEYFYTTCPNICPMLNTNMKTIYDAYRDEPGFVIVSHTCKPEIDSVARLKQYADSLGVNTNRWWFLTGRKDSLYRTARNSYLLDDPKNNVANIDDQFMHTQFFALVDKSGRVRKIYDGLKKDEVRQLQKDISRLLKEPPAQQRFVNNLFNN